MTDIIVQPRTSIIDKIAELNWQDLADAMHTKGYVMVPGFLTELQCEQLVRLYDQPVGYRKTVVMERYRFGLGEYRYFDYPLPNLVQTIRENLYPGLAPIANLWMQLLNINTQFPATYEELQAQCHAAGQLKPTPLILRYGRGGFNTLHQDLYGDVFFSPANGVYAQPAGGGLYRR